MTHIINKQTAINYTHSPNSMPYLNVRNLLLINQIAFLQKLVLKKLMGESIEGSKEVEILSGIRIPHDKS